MTFNLVGLTGVAQSGKDTAARILVEKYGYKRIAFADKLREALYALNPIVFATYGLNHLRVRDIVDRHGWDGAKSITEIRELLQRMGTEAGRAVLGDEIWIDAAFKNIIACQFRGCPCTLAVITDVRFANEAQAIFDRGGCVLRIERPGVGPVNGHISDQPLPSYLISHTIVNDGTIDDLQNKLVSFIQ